MVKRQRKTEKKNPLFVVTNNGQDVESAESFFDALVKKFGLAPIIEFMNTIIQMIVEQVGGMVALELIRGFLDEMVDALEKLLKLVDPVLAFSIIKR
jgi:hypothetical protein